MSQEQAVAFGEHLQSTPSLREEFIALGGNIDGIIALGRREGFTFAASDLEAVIRSKRAEAGQPLSDQELEQAAGGIVATDNMRCWSSTPIAWPI